jgi:hypothetical protein
VGGAASADDLLVLHGVEVAMTISLTVTPTGLRAQFTGSDAAASWCPGLDVPFERIIGSRVMTREDAVSSSPRLPCPGSWLPGRLRAGSWGVGERRQLWAVRDGAYVVVVYLSGRPFHRLVVEVAEPRATHRRLEEALLHSKIAAVRRRQRDSSCGTADE